MAKLEKFKSMPFPEEYPDKLRPISWCVETKGGGVIAGPYKTWFRGLPYETRESELFVDRVIMRFFERHGKDAGKYKELISYIAKHISVYLSVESDEIVVREKKSGEDPFNELEVNKMTGFDDFKATRSFLNFIEKDIEEFYTLIYRDYLETKLRKN